MRIAVIDFETANRYRSSACQLGIAVVEGDKIVAAQEWLIQPKPFQFDHWNVQMHGITADRVIDSPTFNAIWPDVQEFIGDAVVAAHNASFDMSVLRHAMYSNDLTIPTIPYFCTLGMSRAQWPQLACHRLPFLAGIFEIELNSHDALSDAKATAGLILRAMSEYGCSTVNELIDRMQICLRRFDDSYGNTAPRVNSIHNSPASMREFYDGKLNSLEGKAIAFTGDLQWLTREMAAELVVAAGGQFHPAPKRGTTMLVVGDVDIRVLAKGETQSSKLKKAIALRDKGQSIEITTASDFLQSLFQSELPPSEV